MDNKSVKAALLIAAFAVSSSALAMGGTIEQGKNFTSMNFDLGKTSSGTYIEGGWTKNTDDGNSYGGAGVGYNLELGPIMLNAGAKAVYLEPKKGDDGVAFPVGGGITISLPAGFAIYGEGYSAPDGLTNSVKNYVEADGGISWSPVGPVILKAGYRYAGVDGEKGHPGHRLVDGPYIGGGIEF
ncbi:YfaZ family outer membrane protein [Franconibacter helveticus]|uniref:YfaZ family outer membrane protein n=1 Tax=Franconibacter helveticus TaxID=357240 RepID=UPI00066D99FB|nr:YfaZ family outer membrane protein [Franconibacter helveticus]